MKNITEKIVVPSKPMGARASESALTNFVEAASSISLADLLLSQMNAETNARFDVRNAIERLAIAIEAVIDAKVGVKIAEYHRERRLSQGVDNTRLITIPSKR